MTSSYQSPLSSRYASPEMSFLFSAESKTLLFRDLWIALAKAQKELGLPISKEQIDQMEKERKRIDFEKIASFEKLFHHDVMAHVHAFAEVAPLAKGIIHLGATSCFVTDNADLLQIQKGLLLLKKNFLLLIEKLSSSAELFASLPCLAYTHLQPAQPTTLGKRFCLWLQDFVWDFYDLQQLLDEKIFLGAKGATGTQSSFLYLFQGDEKKVKKLDDLIAKTFGFEKALLISSQTYPRKYDIFLSQFFTSFAASAHKFATDLRLLQSMNALSEGFDLKTQVGSSAMPHKRNPILSERVCSLGRFLISLGQNAPYTASLQWLERSLDDSANRRLSISESFLTADAILLLLLQLISHLEIHPAKIEENLKKELPQLALEMILMEKALQGEDRQLTHEKLRQLSFDSCELPEQDFLKRLEKEFSLSKQELQKMMDPKTLVGLAPEQVKTFLAEEVFPLLKKHQVK